MQEGLFLYNHGLSPYDGGVFHQAPLLLPVFSLLPDPSKYPLATIVLYTALDLLAADALMKIAQSGQAYLSRFYTSPRKDQAWSPISIGATYLFNPFIILTCLGRPTSVFTTLFILLSISKACTAAPVTSAFALALASYTSLHPLLLFPPLTILAYDTLNLRHQRRALAKEVDGPPKSQTSAPPSSLLAFSLRQTFILAASIAFLFALSYAVTANDWSFIPSVYGTRLLLPDLTPNVGLWWYFFIEMFDSFRAFFLAVFWLHMASYSPALTIRLRAQPLAVIVLLMGVFAVFQPYASVGDAGVWLALTGVFGHLGECESCPPSPLLLDNSRSHQPAERHADSIAVSRYPFPALSALLYTTFLGPAFYYLWIYAGSGNANFFYAITLVWSLALSVLLGDLLFAVLRDEWEKERPEMKGRSDVARI